MSTSGKWLKSGEAVLTKYQPLTSPDDAKSDVEFEGHEAETSYHDSQPTRSQRNEPSNFIRTCIALHSIHVASYTTNYKHDRYKSHQLY